MNAVRKAGWFFSLAVILACWMGLHGAFRAEALAGVIASHATDGASVRDAEIGNIQVFLEQKIVLRILSDYGVPAEEAMAKIRAMNDRDLHRLASLTDKAAEGTDSGLGLLIGLAILVILVIVILRLSNKQIIIR